MNPRYLTDAQRAILISLFAVQPNSKRDALVILGRDYPDLSSDAAEQIAQVYATARL
jgi:hypothetical protein